jgi:hypothetical protein
MNRLRDHATAQRGPGPGARGSHGGPVAPVFADNDPSVLICRFVGFPLVFDRCPALRAAMLKGAAAAGAAAAAAAAAGAGPTLPGTLSYKAWQEQQQQQQQQPQAQTQPAPASNPLLAVSRHWAAAARAAMAVEWRRGACAEWTLLGEVMGR